MYLIRYELGIPQTTDAVGGEAGCAEHWHLPHGLEGGVTGSMASRSDEVALAVALSRLLMVPWLRAEAGRFESA